MPDGSGVNDNYRLVFWLAMLPGVPVGRGDLDRRARTAAHGGIAQGALSVASR